MPESSAKHAATPAPVARSPLAPAGTPEVIDGWEYAAAPSVDARIAVSDLCALAKVGVRAQTSDAVLAALGTGFARAAWVRDRLVAGSGPDEWLVLGAPGTAAAIIEELGAVPSTGRLSAVDLTHGRALIRLSGPDTLALMARVTAVDLDDRLVPNGSALRTSLAAVATDLIRDDTADGPSFLLHCERSSGAYLQGALLAAGADLGIVNVGSRPAWPDHR